MNNQIIFVDASVQDYQSLIKDSTAGKIVILNDRISGIDQITQALAGEKDIEAIHIVSHGSSGSLKLGSDTLNNQDLAQFQQPIQQWGKALIPNGDILLYGCNVAQTEEG
ncbi:MAG: DUF4347 domain-containing protein, partial [Microcoleaceae cyanobacterium]